MCLGTHNRPCLHAYSYDASTSLCHFLLKLTSFLSKVICTVLNHLKELKEAELSNQAIYVVHEHLTVSDMTQYDVMTKVL